MVRKKNQPAKNDSAQSVAGRGTRRKAVTKQKSDEKPTKDGEYKKYTVFITNTGQEKTFSNEEEAADYHMEMGDTIVDTLTFGTEKAYKEHIKRSSNKTPAKRNASVLTREEEQARARVRATREQNAPKRQMHLQWKTNAYTTACLVTIDFLDMQARPMWFMKAKDTTQTLTAMYMDDILGPLPEKVSELLSNLNYIERVNPLNKEEVDKNGSYIQYKIYSYFLLPEKSKSMQDEHEYIQDTLRSFGNELKTIMSTNIYQHCLRDTIESYSTKLSSATFEPKKGVSFPTYIDKISVSIQQMAHYTDHVPKSSVSTLQQLVQQYELNVRKYPSHLDADNDPDIVTGFEDGTSHGDNTTSNNENATENKD